MMNAFGALSSRRKIALIVTAAVLTVGIALSVLMRPGSGTPSTESKASSPSVAPLRPGLPTTTRASETTLAPVTSPPTRSALPQLARTDSADAYARAVAMALFDVNPAKVNRDEFLQFWRGELATVVYSDGAAKGLTVPTQTADAMGTLIKDWIPAPSVWANEAGEQLASRFTVTSVTVPDYWINAVADGALHDPGLHMERVLGVLNQTYGADGKNRQTTARSVVIDLALLCPPTQADGCRLLAPQPQQSTDDTSS